jgi:hypothetical protein
MLGHKKNLGHEANATTYDTNKNVLLFDGSRWSHINAPWIGERITIVFYNTDFSKHDRWRGLQQVDYHTEEARSQPLLTCPVPIPIDTENSECIELRRAIRDAAAHVEFYHSEQEKYDGKSQMLIFGHTTQPYRPKRRQEARANSKYPELHALLKQYINHLVPAGDGKRTSDMYSSILLAKDSQCHWHTDKQNVSSSLITCVGDYTEGGLCVDHTNPQPLFECMQCHLSYKCLRICRRQCKHTAPDWLTVAYGYMKQGLLERDSELTTRRAIQRAGIG